MIIFYSDVWIHLRQEWKFRSFSVPGELEIKKSPSLNVSKGIELFCALKYFKCKHMQFFQMSSLPVYKCKIPVIESTTHFSMIVK